MPYVVLTLLLCAGGVVAFLASARGERRRTEERAQEARWRRIVEALPQLVWTATADGSADYFSPQTRVSPLSSARPSRIVGRPAQGG